MRVEQPGASSFTQLSDVPNTYAGSADEHLAVNALETGIDFVPEGGGAVWGTITGTLSNQTDLQTALNAKQATLVSGTNIKTINGNSLLGSGDLTISASAAWGSITGTLSAQTDLQTALDGKVDENGAIVGATNTKITYDSKGLVTSGTAATTADINDSTNRRYVTDAQLTVIGNTSGTNTGDQTSIVGITGTLAQFNTALTDADFATGGGTATGTNTGDVSLTGTPNYITISGQTITRGLIDLANHVTGDLLFSNLTQGSARSVLGVAGNATADFASIQGTTDQVLRVDTAGTGLGFGTIATNGITNAAVTYAKIQNVAANTFLANATGSPATVQEIATSRIPLFSSAITGTPSSTTYLRGDGTWTTPSGTGDVTGPASSVDSEIAIFSGTTGKEIKRASNTGMIKATSGVIATATDGTDYFSSSQSFPAANLAHGIINGSTALQSQVVVSGTAYYITGSNITMPATSKTGGGMSTSTRMRWVVGLTKTAAGTGSFQIRIYRGLNGTTADTADATVTLGTQTAAVDTMLLNVTLVVTATGATGSYFYSMHPQNKAVTAAGFGVTSGATFTGTVSSVAMNTASLKFGLAFIATTGTPTITAFVHEAYAWNMN